LVPLLLLLLLLLLRGLREARLVRASLRRVKDILLLVSENTPPYGTDVGLREAMVVRASLRIAKDARSLNNDMSSSACPWV